MFIKSPYQAGKYSTVGIFLEVKKKIQLAYIKIYEDFSSVEVSVLGLKFNFTNLVAV